MSVLLIFDIVALSFLAGMILGSHLIKQSYKPYIKELKESSKYWYEFGSKWHTYGMQRMTEDVKKLIGEKL